MPEYTFKEESVEVSDYRAFFDSKVLRVWHLDNKEKTFTIEKVARLTSSGRDGETKRQPVIRFKGIPLPFALNKTNGATIEQLYGRNPKDWIGKRVTLFPTTTQVGRNTMDCIRVKNKAPAASPGKPEDTVTASPPPEDFAPANPDDDGR
jgi:hypothetical protein